MNLFAPFGLLRWGTSEMKQRCQGFVAAVDTQCSVFGSGRTTPTYRPR